MEEWEGLVSDCILCTDTTICVVQKHLTIAFPPGFFAVGSDLVVVCCCYHSNEFGTLSPSSSGPKKSREKEGYEDRTRASRQITSGLRSFLFVHVELPAAAAKKAAVGTMAESSGLFQKSELHALLQVLMARGCLPLKEAEETFVSICGRSSGKKVQEAVSEINRSIDFAHLRVKFTRFRVPDTKEAVTYVGIANTSADAASTMVTRYSALQVAYFRSVVEAIAEDPDRTIGSKDAMNLGLSMAALECDGLPAEGGSTQLVPSQVHGHPCDAKKLTVSEKQATIERMVEDGWLVQTSSGHVALGPRSSMEIQPFLLAFGLDTSTAPSSPPT